MEFVGLGLRLRSCAKTVLQSVSGRLQPSRCCAIMGPSGALAGVGRGGEPAGMPQGMPHPAAGWFQREPAQLRPTSCDAPVHRCLLLPCAGAGKTSLLNTLAGKAQAYGVQTGQVYVNGVPDRLERFKAVMGFVPQVGRCCRGSMCCCSGRVPGDCAETYGAHLILRPTCTGHMLLLYKLMTCMHSTHTHHPPAGRHHAQHVDSV